jgi:Holliday junction resolvasome RuvABC DNA-binding subunit
LGASKPVALSKNLSEATEALISLGYDRTSIINALKGVDTAKTDVGEIIRLALKRLSR